MLRFLAYRLIQSAIVLFIIVTVTFFLVRAAPGGPYSRERAVSPHILEKLEEQAGLNKPLFEQYTIYMGNLLKGDLMNSYKYEGRRVVDIIGDALPISVNLGLIALVIALGVGIPTGVISAARQNSWVDYSFMSVAMIGICLPTFVLGPLLALFFAINLNFFNASGWYDSTDWVLPSLTLGLYYAAYIARIARGGMLEVLNQDFIRTARAKGVPPSKVLTRHALRGGLLPVISYMGPAFAALITGSFVIEKVFAIPGMGQHFIDAAFNRDFTLISGVVIVYGTLIVFLNLAVDVVQILIDPRQKFSTK
ncbi:MAG: ABC transporter permease subunit [Verrucomicrobiota bacterium]